MTRIPPFHIPQRNANNQWRIMRSENGATVDLCGAIDEAVAWATCVILNAMHRARA